MKWSMRRRAAQRSLLMGALLEAVGVDVHAAAARAGGAAELEAAARRCLDCDRALACGRFVERAKGRCADPPSFCPNAAFFVRVRASGA